MLSDYHHVNWIMLPSLEPWSTRSQHKPYEHSCVATIMHCFYMDANNPTIHDVWLNKKIVDSSLYGVTTLDEFISDIHSYCATLSISVLIVEFLINSIHDFSQQIGRDEWELLTDKVSPDAVQYAVSYGNLKAATSYRFRVTAENDQSISYPTAPSEPHNTPSK